MRNERKEAFVLVDALLALSLATAMVFFELDLVAGYRENLHRAQTQLNQRMKEKAGALEEWRAYKENGVAGNNEKYKESLHSD